MNSCLTSGIGINSSFIALILKSQGANMVKDFRPISLIGSIYKIIAKLLVNRLVTVLDGLVNEVQSAFIANCQILDGPFILNELIHWWKAKKKRSMIFKVDFKKAFDSVRWDFLNDILKNFGFGLRWRDWIQSCLKSLRGSILVNGSPTSEFQFSKGLKQISHLFYANDVVFIGQWCESNLSTIMCVLDCFFRASGLRINLQKCGLMGIAVKTNKVDTAANNLGCRILKSPFSYLGVNIGGHMTRINSWDVLINKILSRLSKWKMKVLSIRGRLTLLKSILGATPIYYMSVFKAPIQEKGGLGVSSFYALNRAIIFKWVWRFRTNPNSLWSRAIMAIHGQDGKLVEICGGKKEDVGLDELGEGGKGVVSKIGEFGGDLGSELLGDRGGEEDERRFIVI
ncbi:RNA-directed DNA polymerase, eukaryota [Tanacetum coccineum]|uniref:RNA-directed DNA polymerase, eukaryota n=1 Tax=Tanacetum coccineum TaxID=301880 RepID=A0ABQ5EXQ0_9ASTR